MKWLSLLRCLKFYECWLFLKTTLTQINILYAYLPGDKHPAVQIRTHSKPQKTDKTPHFSAALHLTIAVTSKNCLKFCRSQFFGGDFLMHPTSQPLFDEDARFSVEWVKTSVAKTEAAFVILGPPRVSIWGGLAFLWKRRVGPHTLFLQEAKASEWCLQRTSIFLYLWYEALHYSVRRKIWQPIVSIDVCQQKRRLWESLEDSFMVP